MSSLFSKMMNKGQSEFAYAAVEGDPNATHNDGSGPPLEPVVQGWPVAPKPVSRSILLIITDLVLLLLPLGFLALAGMAVRLDEMPLSTYGRHVQEVILLAPTIFPLAFAALVGRSLKRIALWKAERGTTLGTLEHLMGSQSVVSTVGHAITLHSLGALPFLLLVLWALSPLGGQSALRLIYETNLTMSETRPVFYANMDSTTDFETQSYNKDAVNRVNAVISSSLMTSDTLEYSHMDTWNHPKIPRIDALETADASNSSNWQWYDINENQVNQTYASLTGLNVVNLKDRASANFTVPYQYLYYNCTLSPLTNASNSVPVNNYLAELQKENRLDGWTETINQTSWTEFMDRGFFLWGMISNSTVITPEKLLYGSQFFSSSLYLFECSMNSVAVEANIVCQSSDCRTTRVRRLKSPRPQSPAAHSYYTFDRVLRHFVAIGGRDPYDGDSKNRNPVDEFVYGVTPWSRDVVTGLGQLLNWTNYVVDPSLTTGMSRRLTKVMNTYWDASRWQVAPTRNDPFGKISINTTSGVPYTSLTMNKTNAFVTWSVPIYKINRPWVATLIVCCCVLFLIGLAGLVLSLRATVPDIFNYVSSLTRDNPYMNVPKGGTFLDGAERASLLRDLPVQLGDVNPMEDVGYLAMQTVDNMQRAEQSRVRKGRMYS